MEENKKTAYQNLHQNLTRRGHKIDARKKAISSV